MPTMEPTTRCTAQADFQEAMDNEFERWIREERLPEDLSATELLSGEVELTFPQRTWLDAWCVLYPGPL
ncbi:MAG: hypothetical protein E6R08_01075 [Nevskiaceae bacterium]|nr:MAG: hypothetical protein E6R08_01075 [Nevskiaceae bacterium]